jgi:hypothetical protein
MEAGKIAKLAEARPSESRRREKCVLQNLKIFQKNEGKI